MLLHTGTEARRECPVSHSLTLCLICLRQGLLLELKLSWQPANPVILLPLSSTAQELQALGASDCSLCVGSVDLNSRRHAEWKVLLRAELYPCCLRGFEPSGLPHCGYNEPCFGSLSSHQTLSLPETHRGSPVVYDRN